MILAFPAFVALHAACAAAYVLLAALVLMRPPPSRSGAWLILASLASAAWAAAFAVSWHTPIGQLPAWLEVGRSAAWYGFILHLYRQSVGDNDQAMPAYRTMGMLALLVLGGTPLLNWLSDSAGAALASLDIAVRLGFAVGNLLLLENLYFNTPPDSRASVNLLCAGLGGLFLYDMLLYADGVLFHRMSLPLLEARAPVAMLAVPLIALAAARTRRWSIDIHVSRDVVFHSVSLIASGIFLLAVALIGEVFRQQDAGWGEVAEMSMVFGAIMAVVVTVTSESVRSRLRALVAETFFSHRYDYRKAWMRCIDALTAPEAFVALHKRAIRAAAEVVDSPAGALFVRPPQDVAFQWAGSWNLPAVGAPVPPGHPLIPLFGAADRIVRLEDHAGSGAWLPDLPDAWIALPLNHCGALIGFIALAHPRIQFKLDREAYDLLRVIGREVASRVAEQRAMQVLTQTQQLREYSQRFAFVIHDIKNVSGQLSMLLANAEVHADNPEFQRDMLATVRASVGKITRLLSRLEAERQERDHALITPADRLPALVELSRLTGKGQVVLRDHSAGAGAAIDPDAFDAIVTHLLNNAVDASGPAGRVLVELRAETHGLVLDIADTGSGMTPEFVRDTLFSPLRSTKSGGHGIGAYQARELLRQAGGDLLVISHTGTGTVMRVILPALQPDQADIALVAA
jgi:putative PEP-CTERM system histidine kinase